MGECGRRYKPRPTSHGHTNHLDGFSQFFVFCYLRNPAQLDLLDHFHQPVRTQQTKIQFDWVHMYLLIKTRIKYTRTFGHRFLPFSPVRLLATCAVVVGGKKMNENIYSSICSFANFYRTQEKSNNNKTKNKKQKQTTNKRTKEQKNKENKTTKQQTTTVISTVPLCRRRGGRAYLLLLGRRVSITLHADKVGVHAHSNVVVDMYLRRLARNDISLT